VTLPETTSAEKRPHQFRQFRRSAEFLSEPYEKSFGPANVAEPIGAKELNRRPEVLDDNAYIVHPLNCHGVTLLTPPSPGATTARSA